MEPLSGYLALACELSKDNSLNGEAFNFGPLGHQNNTVEELLNEMTKHWHDIEWAKNSIKKDTLYEAGLLKLNCDKALHRLSWKPTLNFEETVRWTIEWYKDYYLNGPNEAVNNTFKQIKEYITLASQRNSFKLK